MDAMGNSMDGGGDGYIHIDTTDIPYETSVLEISFSQCITG